jgi:5-methylcytosine-specific restriction endonuclease McrA
MAFRDGKNGPSLWDDCRRRGLAAIEYDPVENVDLSQHLTGEPKDAWEQLRPLQRQSLRRFVYNMKEGDIIYVKEGPRIVGKGLIVGPYQFDKVGRIKSETAYWRHQRSVQWLPDFSDIKFQLGRQQIVTVTPLKAEEVAAFEQTVGQIEDTAVRLPEEVSGGSIHSEGSVQQILVNRYERDPQAREECIKHYGPSCSVCGFDFGAAYGMLVEGFIHVHHLKPLSEIGEEYEVDPVADLRPVCPNCHAVIHHGGGCRGIEEVKRLLDRNRT